MPVKLSKPAAASNKKKNGNQIKKKKNLNSVMASNALHVPSATIMNSKPVAVARSRQYVETYATALVNPFSPAALGAKVPDIYSFPTNSYHVRTTQLLGTGQAAFGAVYLCNPLATQIDLGFISSGVSSVNSKGGFAPYGGFTAVNACSPYANLGAISSEFRAVGGGIRIRNLQPALTGTGRIYVACVPIANGGMMDISTLSNVTPTATGYNTLFSNLGLPSPATCYSPAIQELPLASDYVVSSLIAGDEIDVNFQVFNPVLYTFKASNFAAVLNATQNYGDSVTYVAATGGISTAGSKEQCQSDGSSAIIVYCEGFPTAGVNIEIDFVLHLETTPIVASQATLANAGIAPVPDSVPLTCKGSTMALETVVQAANQPTNIIKEIRTGLSEAQRFDREVLGGAGSDFVKNVAISAMKFMMV